MLKKCASCGNEYEHSIAITQNGRTDYFDCFECAIHLLAPQCSSCGLKVIGHGVEVDNNIFCSAHCAREKVKIGVSDRFTTDAFYAYSEL